MLAFIPLLLFSFAVQSQAFCVHNILDEFKSFKVFQIDDRISKSRRFKKTIYPKWRECCDPSEPTCVVDQTGSVPIAFEVEFSKDNKKKVECVSDGTLFVGGTVENCWAECHSNAGHIKCEDVVSYLSLMGRQSFSAKLWLLLADQPFLVLKYTTPIYRCCYFT
ncbi:hypothetical protein BDB01DRAFT_838427 [Pilobolus umbonatus]|nr:hypothetical protein BDB01DRAFT_838427 [Pilobolus umbonatus]